MIRKTRLTHIRIQNFKSILDTGKTSVGNLCCFVGKNEAGKTALLSALQSLRPYGDPQTSFDVTEDYPRRFTAEYGDRHPNEDAIVVETWWEMSDDARQELINEFGENAVTSQEFIISKRYNQKSASWQMPIRDDIVVKNAINSQRLSAAEKQMVVKASSPKELISIVSDIPSPPEKLLNLRLKFESYRDHSAKRKAIDLLNQFVPTFFYTSHYDRMSGEISAQKISEDQANNKVLPGDKIFLDFLRLSGTSLEELKTSRRFEELIGKCEAASALITDKIFKYWSQNRYLDVKIQMNEGRSEDPAPFNSGAVARSRVYNSLHRASVPFSERSAGFVWFFSFLVQFAIMKRENNNVIILLDEPGLTLHGKAQEDLLRYIVEELLPAHQVLYSTHSPFMVPPKRLSDCRIVEDVIYDNKLDPPHSKGTKVKEDVMSTDKDTLFPLQGALGYSITQSLFIGENVLLVEGVSDIVYLKALSNELDRRERGGLDPRWTVCPAGGISKIRPFVSLFMGNNLNIAVLSDQSSGDKREIERLRKSELLAAESFHTIADLLERDEADIEDILHPSLYCKIINECYDLRGTDKISVEKLNSSDKSSRQAKQAEDYFCLLNKEVPEFSHYRPASWLIQNPNTLHGNSDTIVTTLDRAEKIFSVYNNILQLK